MRALIRSLILLAAGAFSALPLMAADAPATPGLGPQELMEKVSREMLRDLDANRKALEADPSGLHVLVDK